jgi:biopolymer transport protein ExbB
MKPLLIAVALTACLILTAPTLFAQSDTGPDSQQPADTHQPAGAMRVFDHFLVKGGPITWFVLVPLSVATIALTLEYCLSIRRQTIVPPETYQRVADYFKSQNYAEAFQYTANDPSLLAVVIRTGLAESNNGFSAMERAIEESLEERSSRLMRKIEYLNVIGNISPMVGLFGTVFGMISLFASIREAGGMPEPARIADDISIALVTTFWGLLVAIPALSIFALFRNRIDVLTAECAIAADKLLAPFKPGARVAPAAQAAPPQSQPQRQAPTPQPAPPANPTPQQNA